MLQFILVSLLIMTAIMGFFAYFISSGESPLGFMMNKSDSVNKGNSKIIQREYDILREVMESLQQKQSDAKSRADQSLAHTRGLLDKERQKQEDQKQRMLDQQQRALDQRSH